ncbi:DUF3618 domain-containing protein [Allobranchiibius sp. GilTou73]|uniref:DUF3618 domain-containing protein n=1 Tax=Allobranchiibius sp. GilTou73 TaxID=2904523 RepID=UPI001F16A6E7|nr:DUF3618 domain-containing protein [Allobranchiibius sp. GilTou73]UIJ33699.1 DUF3618 domain-containing protein [Allobranchiibius sp. GilTou73]
MSDPDQLAADTRRTQDALSQDVTRLTDRVNPQQFVGTRREKVSRGLSSIKDRVMGVGTSAAQAAKETAQSAADSAQNAGGSAQGAAGSAPDAVRDRASGNPIAAGVIAFGAGWLLSSLLPASDTEQKAAATVEDRASGLTDSAKQSAQDVASNLKQPARDAAQSVQQTATEAANRTAEHAKSATSDVKEHAQDATQDVTDNGSGQSRGAGSIGGRYAG